MLRGLPVARQATTSASRGLVRATRRRLATEVKASTSTTTTTTTLAPKKKSHTIRNIIILTSAGVSTFYVGSAFVSFHVPEYRTFFAENVPGAVSILDFGEDHDWDTLTGGDVILAAQNAGLNAYEFVQRLIGDAENAADKVKALTGGAVEQAKEKAVEVQKKIEGVTEKAGTEARAGVTEAKAKAAAAKAAAADKQRSVVDSLKTGVSISESKVPQSVKHTANQLSSAVAELVAEAEGALGRGTPRDLPEATTTPDQPEPGLPDALGPRVDEPIDPNVYAKPLPLGFEPPPGYTRPAPPKPAKKAPVKEEKPAPEPLPLIAPAITALAAANDEPVLSHLAGTIDELAAFLKAHPSEADKARPVLDTATTDLKQLAADFEKAREAERQKLEQSLDEQAREYSLKVLEVQLEAGDKLEYQQEEFRNVQAQERARLAQVYREKLQQELLTQSELINERLKEEVIAQGIELQRRWMREVRMRVEQERGGRLAKLDELAAGIKKLEAATRDNSSFLDENLRLHAIWSAFRALDSAAHAPARKPFREELRALKGLAAETNDGVVKAALGALEASDAPDVGAEPLGDLSRWFTTSVAPAVSRVALVPDAGAGVLSHLASHAFSTFFFSSNSATREGDDVLSTLARAEGLLAEKDLDGAARELNQLQGTPRVLLKDWLEAARRRLEVDQALRVVHAQATLKSLLVV
ncbi:hypothetical protein PENSPDRAFT_757629 [Peniophora sp. CONT]|nr:hypothetical protein PENSPDRAFT_757629 [Peniophora sp. CONT]